MRACLCVRVCLHGKTEIFHGSMGEEYLVEATYSDGKTERYEGGSVRDPR